MKFEKITNEKIKIILSLSELNSAHITINNIFSNSVSSQNLLQILLSLAEEKLDFKPKDSNLLVEIVTSSDNNYIFTITKLSENKTTIKNFLHLKIFKFDNFNNFIDLCSYLKNMRKLNINSFFNDISLISYNNTYYLKIYDFDFYIFLSNHILEFGEPVSNSFYFDSFLNEHGKKIFEKISLLKYLDSIKGS